MKYLIVSALFIFVQTAQAADESGNITIWGASQKSCFSYINARKSNDDGLYQNYVMGYLTAYNTQTPDTYRLSGNKNLSAIMKWLDDYCDASKTHGFEQALVEFTAKHYPKRYKHPPS